MVRSLVEASPPGDGATSGHSSGAGLYNWAGTVALSHPVATMGRCEPSEPDACPMVES